MQGLAHFLKNVALHLMHQNGTTEVKTQQLTTWANPIVHLHVLMSFMT